MMYAHMSSVAHALTDMLTPSLTLPTPITYMPPNLRVGLIQVGLQQFQQHGRVGLVQPQERGIPGTFKGRLLDLLLSTGLEMVSPPFCDLHAKSLAAFLHRAINMTYPQTTFACTQNNT